MRAGHSETDHLNSLLQATHFGEAARKKTRTVLNRLWLEPRADLAEFASRGITIYRASPTIPAAALSWGMAITTYPFFGKVSEIVGRLTALQGDCAVAEVHRRMSEIYGEREGTRRMTNMVLQSQASWGAIKRAGKGRRLVRKPKMIVQDHALSAWLLEACIRCACRSIGIAAVDSLPLIYPFSLAQPLAYAVLNSAFLEMRGDVPGNQLVDLRS